MNIGETEELINNRMSSFFITVSLVFIVALFISVSQEERFQNGSLSLPYIFQLKRTRNFYLPLELP